MFEPPIIFERVEAPYHLGNQSDFVADAVVIGSGAGGAAVATQLAESGMRTLMLEEGRFHPTKRNSADIVAMMGQLMRDGGTTAIVGKSPISYMEGRCLGGTTVLNGGMCWRTPENVLDEWVSRGLPELSPKNLEPIFEEVEKIIDARFQDPGSAGGANDKFRLGSEKLKWHLSHNRRNQQHCVGSNDCVTGCPSGAKRSTLFTFLPRYLAAGGRLITGMKVHRLHEKDGRIVGVSGLIDNPYRPRKFRVRARYVVLACGAIQTPILIQKSGLHRGNRHIGRHFTIHPNAKVAAYFDEPVDSMRGTHQAWQCTEFVDQGVLLAPGSIPFAFMSLVFPGVGAEIEESLRSWKHMATGGVLVDDSSEGSVRYGPFGVPLVRYDVTDIDQEKFVFASSKLAELYFAAGARKVFTAFQQMPVLNHPDDISKLRQLRPEIERTEYFTAHLMGTCRMSAHPSDGALNTWGELHHLKNLYVADAASLPGTIGVNPQVTIMALAIYIGRRIVDNFRRKSTF